MALLGVLAALVLIAGCNKNRGLESAFSASWRAEGQTSTRQEEGQAVLDRLSRHESLAEVPAAVGVTGRGLRGRALPGGVVWHYVGPVDVMPSLVADRVGFSGAGMVTVLDVRTGQRSFHIPVAGRRLEGMAYDGQHYALLLVDSDDARPDEIRIVDAKGHTTYSATTTSRIGTPHAQGGTLLIPWHRQYVSAFDMQTGASVGRLLVRDAIHQVKGSGADLWVLGAGASHVDAGLLDTVGEQSLRLAPKDLPGDPPWPVDASKPRPPRAQPVAIHAVPTFAGKASFHAGIYAYAYYEIVLGLGVQNQRVKWSNFFPRGTVGSAANEAGITACLEDGAIWQVRWSDGYARRVDTLDTRLKGCVVAPLATTIDGRRKGDFAIQVRETISGTGATMARVHELLIADLANAETVRATHALLAIAQDPTTSSALAERAAAYLAKRRTGASAMIRALRDNVPPVVGEPKPTDEVVANDPEEQTERTDDVDLDLPTTRKRPPPIAALAEALASMNTRNAANVLSAQLTLTSIDGADSRAVLQALGTLGGKKQVRAVHAFFMNFKNGGGDRAMLDALVLAARFLLQHGGEEERSMLRAAETDVLTHPELAKSLAELELEAPPQSDGSPQTSSQLPENSTNPPPAQDKSRPPVP